MQAITLDQALQQAGSRNPQLQIAGLVLISNKPYDERPMMQDGFQCRPWLGQYNSRQFDNNLTISQTIPNPTPDAPMAE